MKTTSVKRPPPPISRHRPVTLAAEAGRRLTNSSRTRGRAWINGREVGGASDRFAHLGRSHD
jgi:hypothetical protein